MQKKRAMLLPAGVLAGILVFCIWNGAAMSGHVRRWQEPLLEADRLAQAGDWPGAAAALEEGYADWQSRQTYLHIVTQHGAVDDAEAMFHRCMAFASCREDSEFQAELADLREQLRLLAEMEEFSWRNVL